MKVLLLNQCFHPDHVATAQYLTDLAHALVQAGHQVTVVASCRGYDDPAIRYPVREQWQGINIRRIWTPGLGKQAKWRRLIDFASGLCYGLNGSMEKVATGVYLLKPLPRQTGYDDSSAGA